MLKPIKSDQHSTDTNNKLELEADFNTTLIQHPQDDDGKTYAILDDATLIRKFVQGEKQLLANQSLRIDSSFERIELTTRKGVIIGLHTLNTEPISVLIRSGSEYNELLYGSLLENNFILIGKSNQKGFVEYQQYIPPTGYKVNCTPTVVLWRNWWMGERKAHKHQIQMDILISFKNKWYPISEISSHQGVFHIKTLVCELTLHSDEKIIWVSKLEEDFNPAGGENLVQPNSNLGVAPNSSDKFNTQQVAGTEIQSSPTKIQNSNQENNHLKEQSNSELEVSNFNNKQANQQKNLTNYNNSKNSNFANNYSSNSLNSGGDNFKAQENFTIKNSDDQPKGHSFQTLNNAPLEENLQSLKIKALQLLENYIVNGATETITEEVRNAHGQTIQAKSLTIKNKCPNWVIESILQKNDSIQKHPSNCKKLKENSEEEYIHFPL